MNSTLTKPKSKARPSGGPRNTASKATTPQASAAQGRRNGSYSAGPVFGLGASHVQAKMQPGAAVEQEEKPDGSVVQRVCAECAAEAGGDKKEEVQTKLTVTEPNDQFEQEADSVADGVMRMADVEQEEETPAVQTKPAVTRLNGGGVQRKTELPKVPDASIAPEGKTPGAPPAEAEGATPEKGEAEAPAAEEKKAGAEIELPEPQPQPPLLDPPIQMRSQAGAAPAPRAAASVQSTLPATKGGGRPLAPAVQGHMERGFGRDFSDVRVHTDGTAGRMNRDLKARAFTHQGDIYFNAGEYRPESPAGKRLLAHELTHTIQQGAAGDTVQRWFSPPQDVTTEPEPAKTDDGAEVEGRMNEKIADDDRVKDPDDLDDDEKEEAKHPNRGEVRQESGEISASGEAKPSVDRPADAQAKTAEQSQEINAEVTDQPQEATEEKAEGEGEEAPLSAADAAAQRSLAAQARAQSVEIPPEPQAFRHPRIEVPKDSKGEELPRNTQVDTQVRGLGYIAEMLREQGYQMKRHAAQQMTGSYGLDAVLEREREDLANANEGTAQIETHTEARKEISEQSRLAHSESVQRQQFVAATAPGLAGKAEEGSSDSGELAAEASSKAGRSRGEIPDDDDARGDAEEQAGEMESTAEGAQSMDNAIRQTGQRARQYEADAAAAAEQNEQSDAEITATDDVIIQTEARIADMQAKNAESEAQIGNAAPGPGTIRGFARRTDSSGDQLIAETIVMEADLYDIQEQYLGGMQAIESREAAIKRQQAEEKEAAKTELSREERTLFELAGMEGKEQEERVGEMKQPERDSLLSTLEKMIKTAPATGTEETEGARLKVDTGLTQALMGEQPADPRQKQIQEVEDRRTERVGGVLDVADRNMNFLTEEQQQMLANRLVTSSITDDIKNIHVLQMGKDMIKGMIDPRQSLAGIVGGFEKLGSGLANIGNWEAWQKDPLGNLLQIAADISTGLATIFSTILGIAGTIVAVMVALTIISWGFLSWFTAPVIGWMGTIMTYAGWGALITGGLSVYFNYLSYIKNLHDAGTAETSRELFGNVEQMKGNVTDGFQGAMAVAAGYGGVKMGPSLRSGQFFAELPKSPGAWARQTLASAKRKIAAIAGAPAALVRGVRALFRGGRRGLVEFKNRVVRLFTRRHPGEAEVNLPEANPRQQHARETSTHQRLEDMDSQGLRAELNEARHNRPRQVSPESEHFADYDVEVESNGHTYRRRRDGHGWCRFSDGGDCFVHLDSSARRALGIGDDFGDDVFDEYFAHDPNVERAENRRLRQEPGGREAHREAIRDIRGTGEPRGTGEKATPVLSEGVPDWRGSYMGDTPGKRSPIGEQVIERMRNDGLILGRPGRERVWTRGPDGVERWYPIRETDMGHIEAAVTRWNTEGINWGPKHPQLRKFMRNPNNYELQHWRVNQAAGRALGRTQRYRPPKSL